MVGPVAGNGAASSSDATTSRSGTAHSDIGVALRVQVEELRRDNARLAELLNAKPPGSLTICGYLYKFRYYATGISQSSWKKRFFTLHGSTLSYYLTERDTQHHPRGIMDLQSCILEREPLKKGRFHTFGVVNRPSALELIRMSTESETDAERWIHALRTAGCEERQLTPDSRIREPLPAADVRWGSPSPAKSADSGAELRNRWAGPRVEVTSAPSTGMDISDSAISDISALRVPLRGEIRAARRLPMTWSTPLHKGSRASIMSYERLSQMRTHSSQHSGVFTLAMVIIVATNVRLLLENFLKYGLLLGKGVVVTGALRGLAPTNNLRLLACWPAVLFLCFLVFWWEKFGAWRVMKDVKTVKAKANKGLNPSQAKRKRRQLGHPFEWLMGPVNAVLICLICGLPSRVIASTRADPLPASSLFFVSIILWMKLVSYVTALYDFRKARRANELLPGERGTPEAEMDGVPHSAHLQYPENVTASNFAYFLLAPTLIYQLTYPRSARFRSRWVLGNFAKLAFALALMLLLVEQYVEPAIRNTKPSFDNGDYLRILERILKLAIPTLYVWLCIFYSLFHAWLNILAEFLHFGDREFYKDWWNAVTIGDYWRLWNMPVHKWMLRTVYYPSISFGVSKGIAGVLVFFVSAVFHELLVGVPLRMNSFPYWSFLGIMGQVPLMFITNWVYRKSRNESIGNLTFWFSFCIFGQPWALLKYYIAYVDANK